MYRIRFHGRGGQGMKTASRILGTSFFLQGYEVQDAPRYGAERRGAPVFAYVRASKHKINERGIIRTPDLVTIADDSLFEVCPAALTAGLTRNTVMLINTMHGTAAIQHGETSCSIVTLSCEKTGQAAAPGTLCAAASAGLCRVISRENFKAAMIEELSGIGPEVLEAEVENALEIFDSMSSRPEAINESADIPADPPGSAGWIDLPHHDTWRSVPAIHRGRTGVLNRTGSWRTQRPFIRTDACSRCMLCALYCPDSVISPDSAGLPVIDYDHCKGCMICGSVCPGHAIDRINEHQRRMPEDDA